MQRGVEEKPKSAMYQRNIPVSIKPAQAAKKRIWHKCSTEQPLHFHLQ
jgi:hypothetical protein